MSWAGWYAFLCVLVRERCNMVFDSCIAHPSTLISEHITLLWEVQVWSSLFGSSSQWPHQLMQIRFPNDSHFNSIRRFTRIRLGQSVLLACDETHPMEAISIIFPVYNGFISIVSKASSLPKLLHSRYLNLHYLFINVVKTLCIKIQAIPSLQYIEVPNCTQQEGTVCRSKAQFEVLV